MTNSNGIFLRTVLAIIDLGQVVPTGTHKGSLGQKAHHVSVLSKNIGAIFGHEWRSYPV